MEHSIAVPDYFSRFLSRQQRKATLAALQRQADLVLAFRALAQADTPAVALKGAALAFHRYPHPAHRPMRDLDILVPEAQVLQAYQTLQAQGFKRSPKHPGDPRAHMAQRKHLPHLIGPNGSIVELHHRLSEWRNPLAPEAEQRGADHFDLADAEGYWDRLVCHQVAGSPIWFPDPTDLLLHLCVHAAYDDRFSGGALTLFDIDLLLAQTEPDWPRFWRDAERGGWLRGCALLLRLQQHLFEARTIAWPESDPTAELPPEHFEQLAPLLLSDIRAGRRGRLSKESETGASKQQTLVLGLARLFPPRNKVAVLFTVPADSLRAFTYYPRYWWRLIAERLPEYWRARRQTEVLREEQERTQVESWLRDDASDDHAASRVIPSSKMSRPGSSPHPNPLPGGEGKPARPKTTLAETWRKFRAIPLFELAWALPAWLLLGIGRLMVLAVPFRKLAPRLGVNTGVEPWLPLVTPEQERRARMLGRIVRRSARYTPWTSNCFNQAIAARLLLGLYRVPYMLFFGVRRNDASGLDAHAWVSAGRIDVTGSKSFGQYTVVGCFAAPGLARAERVGAASAAISAKSNTLRGKCRSQSSDDHSD